MAQLVERCGSPWSTPWTTRPSRPGGGGVQVRRAPRPSSSDYLDPHRRCKVDNVPGVPKVGPEDGGEVAATSTAPWDGVLAHADEPSSGKVGENLREMSSDHLPLSHALVTIKRDVELDRGKPSGSDAAREPDRGKAAQEAVLASSSSRPGSRSCSRGRTARRPRRRRPSEARLRDGARQEADPAQAGSSASPRAPVFAVDTETTSLDYMQARIWWACPSRCEPGEAAYVPVRARLSRARPPSSPPRRSSGLSRPCSRIRMRAKVGQNLKYDMSVLARHGIDPARACATTPCSSPMSWTAPASRHDMDTLALKHLRRIAPSTTRTWPARGPSR